MAELPRSPRRAEPGPSRPRCCPSDHPWTSDELVAGYDHVADFDLEKFFDRVNHDRLMARVADRVDDKRVLELIRAFLNAGLMEGGLVTSAQVDRRLVAEEIGRHDADPAGALRRRRG